MYLLIPRSDIKAIVPIVKFTFHNVSINSAMTLYEIDSAIIFTFHNVSINSKAGTVTLANTTIFTFHNVSINSTF